VCNNNAAATWLILNELSEGREVICSRAHMVEIGGSYRMPEVMKRSGAKLVEVGATNKCRASDYESAITPNTGCIIEVHTSNYRIEGFTEFASLAELVEVGRRHNVPVVFDLGAGSLVDLRPYGLHDEPVVQELIRQGADLVCFSGDKLLGGPQAGICVGRRDLIQRLKKNQMFRMLRCDKVTLSLLEATLRLYRNPETVWQTVPTLNMISQALGIVQERAERLMLALSEVSGISCELVPHEAYIGGGSLPAERLPSYAVRVEANGYTVDGLATALRRGEPSVFGRIVGNQFLIDCRTLQDFDVDDVALAFSRMEREV
jgi:L-seryl-tRNA(Ser) seleniumtransferase